MTEGGKKIDSLTASVPVTLPVTELLSEMFSCPNSQRASAVLMVVKKRVHNLNNHDCSESETAAATPQGFRHSCNMTLTGFEMFTVPCKLELSDASGSQVILAVAIQCRSKLAENFKSSFSLGLSIRRQTRPGCP